MRQSSFAPSKSIITTHQLQAAFKTSSDLEQYRTILHERRILVNNNETILKRPSKRRIRAPQQVYCQGWFADRSQMKFKMNEYFTQGDEQPTTTQPSNRVNRSFTFHPRNQARCARLMSISNPPVTSPARDEVRYTYNRLLKQIDREVSREQRDQSFDSMGPPKLCHIGDTTQDLDQVCLKSNINLNKLKSLLNRTSYKSPIDTIIGMLKE